MAINSAGKPIEILQWLRELGLEQYTDAFGLMSYGASFPAMYHHAATFVDKLLKGAKPSELPVEEASTFELAINRKTAEALGLKIPPTLIARADELIE